MKMPRVFVVLLLVVSVFFSISLSNFAKGDETNPQDQETDNHLEAIAENGIDLFEAEYGESITLAVTASCDQGNLHYQWIKYWYDDYSNYCFEEVTSSEPRIEVVVTEANRNYICVVTDDFGGKIEVTFYLQMNNIRIIGTQPDSFSHYNAIGDNIVLSVNAECKVGQLRYCWLCEGIEIEGETTNTLTVTIDSLGYHSYVCRVGDNIGNSIDVWFGLNYDNELTANSDQEIVKPLGTTITLHTIASCREGSLHYRWFQSITGWNDPELDETSDTLTITVNDAFASYYCIVSDDFNDGETVNYDIFGAHQMNMGESSCIQMPSGYRWTYVGLKPVISGMYEINTSIPDVEYGVTLYDENMNLVESLGDAQVYELQAGEQYYYQIFAMSYIDYDIPITFKIVSEVVPDLVLPSSLTEIESQAFIGIPVYSIIYVPETVTKIANDAFNSQTVILTPENSWANKWASTNGFSVAFSSMEK